jgi:hypothetical protein
MDDLVLPAGNTKTRGGIETCVMPDNTQTYPLGSAPRRRFCLPRHTRVKQ